MKHAMSMQEFGIDPGLGCCGRRLVERLPDTLLADEQRLDVLRNPPPEFIVPDPFGLTAPEESAAGDQQEQAPDPFAAPYLHPRPLPASPPAEIGCVDPPQRATHRDETIQHEPDPARCQTDPTACMEMAANCTPHTPTAEHPDPSIQQPSSENAASFPDPSAEFPTLDPRLPWQYDLRVACSTSLVPDASILDPVLSPLSPKTSVATKRPPHDTPPNQAPVSREAVAERGPEPVE